MCENPDLACSPSAPPHAANRQTQRQARRHPGLLPGGCAGLDRPHAARVVAARRQRRGDQRRRQPADADLSARLPRAGGAAGGRGARRVGGADPRGHRRVRGGGGDAAHRRPRAAAVRAAHRRNRRAVRRARPRVEGPAPGAGARRRRRRPRRGPVADRAVRRRRQCTGGHAGAGHRAGDVAAAHASSSRWWRWRSSAPWRSSISRSCSSSGRCTSSRTACSGWRRATSTSACRSSRRTSSARWPRGFNHMAEELQESYRTLERRVADKTQSLAQQNARLATLYDMTALLNAPSTQEDLCRGFLRRLLRRDGRRRRRGAPDVAATATRCTCSSRTGSRRRSTTRSTASRAASAPAARPPRAARR